MELNTQAQQREAVVQGRSLSPYRIRYDNLPMIVYADNYTRIEYIGCRA
ncbi:MAG: hypothetical protein LBJ00_14830 [Planctomycetaceae bacterium]|nr:hypothetical protein [Planctomycetaceae bacterium]